MHFKSIPVKKIKRNSRIRVDKKSGRKQPRPNDTDIEIIPAQDSQGSTLVADDINMPGKRTKLIDLVDKTKSPDKYALNDLINLEGESRNVPIETNEMKFLKDWILGKQWLSSDHMGHVNKLILDAGYSLNGFQDTILAPVLQKDQTWFIPDNGLQSQAPPSVNVHYNSQKHWVTSFQFENGDICLLDSSLGRKIENYINDSLKVQLAQVYGSGKSQITVKVPQIQQKNNGHDCGLFAIANLMEFITEWYSGLKDGTLEFDFIQNEMRGHLIKYFTQQYMEPFPK